MPEYTHLLEQYPDIAPDLTAVGLWLNQNPEILHYTIIFQPIEIFVSSIQSMLDSYIHFPKDEKRTQKIVRLLKKGALQYPVFCDKDGFVMEGRHRLVAFYLMKYQTVPVITMHE